MLTDLKTIIISDVSALNIHVTGSKGHYTKPLVDLPFVNTKTKKTHACTYLFALTIKGVYHLNKSSLSLTSIKFSLIYIYIDSKIVIRALKLWSNCTLFMYSKQSINLFHIIANDMWSDFGN